MGGLFLWNVSYALHTILIPSSCGMLVYKLATSIETSIRGMDPNVTPQTLVETLDYANSQFYPGVYVALVLLLTYPVSTCTAEGSFSSMKRLKSPLRSTMTDERLRAAACKNRELHFSDHLVEFLIFCLKIPLD